MPTPIRTVRVPSYRRHKPSGQAVVTLSGRDVYLGPWKSAASKREYKRLAAEWLASGGQVRPDTPGASLTVLELVAAYWAHLGERTGRPRSRASSVRWAHSAGSTGTWS